MRLLCVRLNVHYVTRKNLSFAKAGNLNNALRQGSGELVAIFDADMIPKSNFLEEMVGYFVDVKMGFVQAPQAFYNPDPFQYNFKFYNQIPNELDFFMRDIQRGRGCHNAVLHVGPNAVFRRCAIDEIGGIPTDSLTEDTATGMLIQAKGYKSVFVTKVLATGLSAESFKNLLKQRERWCRGNIQVLKKWNPLTIKGLNTLQRILYFDGLIYWFFGIQKMIFIICPLLYLFFGFTILNTNLIDLLLLWIPSFTASVLSFHTLGSKNRNFIWSHIYEVALAPYLSAISLFELISSESIPFRVTPKKVNLEKVKFSWGAALPHIILLSLTIMGWCNVFFQLRNGIEPYAICTSIIINLVWSLYNAFAFTVTILACFERPRFRKSERISTNADVVLFNSKYSSSTCGTLIDISECGMLIQYGLQDLGKGDEVLIDFRGIKKIPAQVVRLKMLTSGESELGVKFNGLSECQYEDIVKYMANQAQGYHVV